MAAMLHRVREQGLATRDPHVRTVSNTLAVPILEGSRVVASVGLTFIASAMTQDEAIRRHHHDLVELSAAITRRLASLAGRSTEEMARSSRSHQPDRRHSRSTSHSI
jgi:IclR family mhp operon transcriptional activator